MAQKVKTTRNPGDLGSIPRSGKSLEKGMANYFNIPAWRIPWTEEPGGLQSMESQELDMTEQLNLIMLLHLLEAVHSFLFFIYLF